MQNGPWQLLAQVEEIQAASDGVTALEVGWMLFLFLGIPVAINGLVVAFILLGRRRRASGRDAAVASGDPSES